MYMKQDHSCLAASLKKMEIHIVYVCVLIFVFKNYFCVGSGSQELWIYTPNDGNNDAWSTNPYQYYTRLSDYDIYPQNELNFNFKFAAGSLYCKHVMVLLSSAADMQSNNFYELFISIHSDVRRKKNNVVTHYPQPSVEPANCIDFRGFKVSWNSQGHIQVEQDGIGLINYMDSTPMTIQSVGIKTGFSDKGIWAIQHSGTFTGIFCNKPGKYGNMLLLWEGYTKSSIVCTTMCSGEDECLGTNFNRKTNECRLLRSRQITTSYPAVDWLFSAKCLNNKYMCVACF